jgi:hypothetical protein
MRLESEAELAQNPALGALLLWAFSREYRERSNLLNVHQLVPVLPMVFHLDTVDAIHSRRFDGGFELALSQHPALVVDLDQRCRDLIGLTLRSLNIAVAAELLSFERQTATIGVARRTEPRVAISDEVRKMLNAARRVGYAFATIDKVRLRAVLGVSV